MFGFYYEMVMHFQHVEVGLYLLYKECVVEMRVQALSPS